MEVNLSLALLPVAAVGPQYVHGEMCDHASVSLKQSPPLLPLTHFPSVIYRFTQTLSHPTQETLDKVCCRSIKTIRIPPSHLFSPHKQPRFMFCRKTHFSLLYVQTWESVSHCVISNNHRKRFMGRDVESLRRKRLQSQYL